MAICSVAPASRFTEFEPRVLTALCPEGATARFDRSSSRPGTATSATASSVRTKAGAGAAAGRHETLLLREFVCFVTIAGWTTHAKEPSVCLALGAGSRRQMKL